MVKMMCNDQLVYKAVIWAFFLISLWTEKVELKHLIKFELMKREGSFKLWMKALHHLM